MGRNVIKFKNKINSTSYTYAFVKASYSRCFQFTVTMIYVQELNIHSKYLAAFIITS